MSVELNKRTRCGWHNWRKMSAVLCDKRIGLPPHCKGYIHNMIVQPATLYGMGTVPMTSFHVNKREVTEMKMMHGHAESVCGHTLRDHVRNDNSRDRLEVENITERYTTREETIDQEYVGRNRPTDGTTWEKKKKKIEAEMDGLSQPRHESYRDNRI